MNVYAKFTKPYSIEAQRWIGNGDPRVMQRNVAYKVIKIDMGQSSTRIQFDSLDGSFNSVFFTFFDEYDNEIDIYSMKEFNPYLSIYP